MTEEELMLQNILKGAVSRECAVNILAEFARVMISSRSNHPIDPKDMIVHEVLKVLSKYNLEIIK